MIYGISTPFCTRPFQGHPFPHPKIQELIAQYRAPSRVYTDNGLPSHQKNLRNFTSINTFSTLPPAPLPLVQWLHKVAGHDTQDFSQYQLRCWNIPRRSAEGSPVVNPNWSKNAFPKGNSAQQGYPAPRQILNACQHGSSLEPPHFEEADAKAMPQQVSQHKATIPAKPWPGSPLAVPSGPKLIHPWHHS